MALVPTVDEVRTWTKAPVEQLSDQMLGDILAAEVENQASMCRIPFTSTDFPASLRMSLFRRCAREFALKGIPLGVISGIADGQSGISRVSGIDREIERLEKPFRKLAAG